MTKSGRVHITCNACGVQVFARGDEADELMRDQFIAANERNVTNGEALPAPPVTNEQGRGGFAVWPEM